MTPRRRIAYVLSGCVFLLSLILAESWVLSLEHRLRGKILRIQVVIIIQLFVSVISIFVWRNFIYPFSEQTKGRSRHIARSQLIWKTVVFIYICLAHGSYLGNVFLVFTEPSYLGLLCYLCLGFHVQLFTFLVLTKVVNLALSFTKRRPINRKITVYLAVAYAFLLTSYGFYNTRQLPVVKHVDISLKRLSSNLNGFTITLLSDIHLGPTVGKTQFEKAVQISNNLDSDIVVIDGDLVDGLVTQLEEAVSPIQSLKSRYGIYYVTGNHEYYTMDVENWFEKLESLGITVLHNRNVKVPNGNKDDQSMCLIGTDDLEADRIRYEGHGMKLDEAISGCSNNQLKILLAHQPQAARKALNSGHNIDVILCGHTHGGQMFPITIGAYFANPYYAGLYQHEGTYIYVTMGTYYWGFPVRVMTQHEITRITLKSI